MSTYQLAERSYQLVGRPSAKANWRSRSSYHTAGLVVAVLGLMAVLAASIADLTAVHHLRQDTLAWSFGLNFVGFNVIKIGIGVALMGIIIRLWMRVDSVKVALVDLKASAEGEQARTAGEIDTDYGRAEITERAPGALWIHKLAEYMWTPLLVMGRWSSPPVWRCRSCRPTRRSARAPSPTSGPLRRPRRSWARR